MRGTRWASLAVGALFLALVAPQSAAADAVVRMDGTTLVVDDAGGAVIVRIKQFVDGSRNGVRVEQGFPGAPAITSQDADCTHNPFFNDVVCTPFPSRGVIDTGDEHDFVVVGGSNFACTTYSGTPFTVDLEGGPDFLHVSSACGGNSSAPGVLRLEPIYTNAFGGPGFDDLHGADLNDNLSGGPGLDRLIGNGGNDALFGGSEADVLLGGDGSDILDGGSGADEITGGPGTDVATYASRSEAVTATLDETANDGAAGENDDLTGIQTIIGGTGEDTLSGNNGANRLEGRDGDDNLEGDSGEDELRGDGGNDLIDSHEAPAVQDSVSCGFGFDTVIADLQDNVPGIIFGSSIGCESVERFAADDGRPGRIVGRSVRIRRSGRLKLRLRCPRRARVTCKGRLRLKHTGGRRTLASKRYRVRRGKTKTLRLKLSRRAARRARARKAIVVRTRERGVSKKFRFRGSVVTLRVRQ